MVALYRGLSHLLSPGVRWYLKRRLARGKEDPVRMPERFGHASQPRPAGPLIWLHGASVGEALSLLPLIARLKASYPHVTLLVTSGTVTSATILADRLPEGVIHQFLPVDLPDPVQRFLNHWKPSLVLWAESELWPNLLTEWRQRDVQAVLINGRMSEKSFSTWRKLPWLIKPMLKCFDLVIGQTEADTARLKGLGAGEVRCIGNLKFAAEPLPANEECLTEMRKRIAARPVWLAASTWPGEEDIAGETHIALKATLPDLLTVIVPRHAGRGMEIFETLRAKNLQVGMRSRGALIEPTTDVYLSDTMGELGIFMRLASVVFMGKSLTEPGGQNPVEPALLAKGVLHGPKMDNFQELSERMLAAGGSRLVTDATDLKMELATLLTSPRAAEAFGKHAYVFASAEGEVLDRLMDSLSPQLKRLQGAWGLRP